MLYKEDTKGVQETMLRRTKEEGAFVVCRFVARPRAIHSKNRILKRISAAQHAQKKNCEIQFIYVGYVVCIIYNVSMLYLKTTIIDVGKEWSRAYNTVGRPKMLWQKTTR
jgi:hypothetical protein